jgi:[ribosomal protein S5]-alanine N-acetyltransferase
MKLTLRKPKMSDLKQFHGVFNDKEMAKQISGYSYPSTIEQSKQKLQEIINENKRGDYYEFAIIVNENFVGSIVLEKPSKDKKIFTLGYAVGRRYWNKGIATEAVKKIIQFGFNKLKLKKIIADNDEDNLSSARVLEKNGFSFIKKTRKTRRKTGKKINVLYWEKVK